MLTNSFKQIFEDFEENIVEIFTDGSKILDAETVGSACYCPRLSITSCTSLNSYASVFTAECVALRDTLDISLKNPGHNFYIFSDSLSALQSLETPKIDITTSTYILDIRQKYNEVMNKPTTTVKLFWIPSHRGIGGNEEADRLAKAATNLQGVNRLSIPFTDFRETFKSISKQNDLACIQYEGLSKGK